MEPFLFPILIFFARTADISLQTIRIISVNQGKKLLSFCLGFVEVLIWIGAISVTLKHISNPFNVIAYAAGFGFGNYIGIILEEKLILRKLLIRIFSVAKTEELKGKIKSKGYGVTALEGKGKEGPVEILYAIINREDYAAIERLIQEVNPKAFYTVEDIKTAKEGVFPPRRTGLRRLRP